MVTARVTGDALEALQTLTQAIANATALDDIFDASLKCLADALLVDRSSILLFDDQQVMRFRSWRGLSGAYRAAVEGHNPWPAGTVDPRPVLVPDVEADPDLAPIIDVLRSEDIRAAAFIPLTVTGRLIGKFMLYYRAPHEFAPDELLTARAIGTQIAFAIGKQQSHEAVTASEQRYRGLVEGMGLAAYTTDAAGYVTYFNEQAVTLWGRRPVVGEDLWCGSHAIYWPDGQAMTHSECPMAIAVKENRPVRDVEVVLARPNGERLRVLPFPTPLRDAQGVVIGGVNVLMDITERHALEAERLHLLAAEQEARERAEAAVRARDEFLSIASHELRNPVAAIKGTAQLLQRIWRSGERPESQLQQYVGGLVQASDRLAQLLDDLLDVVRLETGQVGLRPDRFDLVALVQDVLRECQEGALRHQLALRNDEAARAVLADPLRLREVLVNLLENAVKYSPAGGAISVTVGADGADVVVTVSDEGIGFPSDAAEQIFAPFGRASNAVNANIPGMGLGLHISRRLIEAHGGSLRASSEGEGRGTQVVVRLPSTQHPSTQ